jgi:hypothetical protein
MPHFTEAKGPGFSTFQHTSVQITSLGYINYTERKMHSLQLNGKPKAGSLNA